MVSDAFDSLIDAHRDAEVSHRVAAGKHHNAADEHLAMIAWLQSGIAPPAPTPPPAPPPGPGPGPAPAPAPEPDPVPAQRDDAAIRAIIEDEFPKVTTHVLGVPHPMDAWVAHFRQQPFASMDATSFRAAVHAQVVADAEIYDWPPAGEPPPPAPAPPAPPPVQGMENGQFPPLVGEYPTSSVAREIQRMQGRDGYYGYKNTETGGPGRPPMSIAAVGMPFRRATWNAAYENNSTLHERIRNLVSWFWAFEGHNSTASNKRLAGRRLQGGIQLDSFDGPWIYTPFAGMVNDDSKTPWGQWWRHDVENEFGPPVSLPTHGANPPARRGVTVLSPVETDWTSQPWAEHVPGIPAETILLDPQGIWGIEEWPGNFVLGSWDESTIARAVNCCVVMEAYVANPDGTWYSGDDAKFSSKTGWDGYDGTGATGGNPVAANPSFRHASGNVRADGGGAGWYEINGSMGVVMLSCFGIAGTQDAVNPRGTMPPWGNWGPPQWPYDDPPHVPTVAQFMASPPRYFI